MKTTGSARSCGCCEGIQRLTPMPTANRPGLEALAYRVGTHARFLETMKARLSTLCLGDEDECRGGQGLRPLQRLTTRAGDDPAVAFLDAWATLADVLTFYQERLANEGYLRTATERRSILELARLVGYRLRPGVAASVFLAFELEQGYQVEIPAGTRAQSLPAPGELPQPFETRQPFLARAEWNELKPRMSEPQILKDISSSIYLAGTQVNLAPNDPVLVVSTQDGNPKPVFRRVRRIEAELTEDRSRVFLKGPLNLEPLISAMGRALPDRIPVKRVSPPENLAPPDYKLDVDSTQPLTLEWKASERSSTKADTWVTYTVYYGHEEMKPIANLPEVADDPEDQITYEAGDQVSFELEAKWLSAGTSFSWAIRATDDLSFIMGSPFSFTTKGELETPELPDPVEPPIPPAAPGEQDSLRETAAKNLIASVKQKLGFEEDPSPGSAADTDEPLLTHLRDPDVSVEALRKYVQIETPSLESYQRILENFGQLPYPESSLDFGEVVNWISNAVTALNGILDQLADLPVIEITPGRLFENQSIRSGVINQIIVEAGNLSQLVEESGIVEQIGAAEFLSKLYMDLMDLSDMRDLSEDDKIVKLKAQIRRVEGLQIICDTLDGQDAISEWVRELASLMSGAIKTDAPAEAAEAAETFPEFISRLKAPPSRPPADPLRLERDINEVFGAEADIATRMLTALRPGLKSTFYQAWARAEFAPLPPFQSFEALRVKATPFGAKAPFKPIYGGDGVIIGRKEWPLFGISVRLSFHKKHASKSFPPFAYTPPVEISISLTQDAETREQTRMLFPSGQDSITRKTTLRGLPVTIRLDTRFVYLDPVDIHHLPPPPPERVIKQLIISVADQEVAKLVGVRAHNVTIGKDSVVLDTDDTRTLNDGLTVVTTSQSKMSTLIDDIPIPIPPQMQHTLTLDAEYDKITEDSWVVIERPISQAADEKPLICSVDKVQTISKAGYGRVTELTLKTPWLEANDRSLSVFRGTTIYAQSEPLELAEEPITQEIAGNEIRLGSLYGGLEAGRWLIVSGERTDIPGTSGVRASELVMLSGVRHVVQQFNLGDQGTPILVELDTPHSTIVLANDLAFRYQRSTVVIYGNVIQATHGETRQEVLGSGDGSQAGQTFTLRQSPLTYLAAATPTGAQSTLKLHVNDILWHEADNLIWLDANDRGYITRADDQEKTTLVFGDGQHGARLPTGLENVTAVYRTGIGKAGNVEAGRISLLAARPLGVKGVVNPLPATGGADRERRDQARFNAPLAVMALDRLVSIQDYADFARAYAGIDKAHAVRAPDGRRELILLSIAGADDIPIDPLSSLFENLTLALHQFGSPNRYVKVVTRELILLVINASIRLHPDYKWEAVAPQIRTALLETFSFDRRQLGQDVLLSEVLSVIQRVPGVIYANVDILDGVPEDIPHDELTKIADDLNLNDRIMVSTGRIQTHHVVKGKHETLKSIAERYEHITPEQLYLWNRSDPRVENKRPDDLLQIDTRLSLNGPQIRAAQIAYLSPELPDTLILRELT
jgi:hypothetical protein